MAPEPKEMLIWLQPMLWNLVPDYDDVFRIIKRINFADVQLPETLNAISDAEACARIVIAAREYRRYLFS